MGHIAEALRKAELQRELSRDAASRIHAVASVPSHHDLRFTTTSTAPLEPDASPPVRPYTIGIEPNAAAHVKWDVHPSLVARHDKACAVTEQYRAMRTWLLARMPPSGRTCHAITSAVPREGKSVTTANLALVMAEVRHLRVLVIDGDLRQNTLARLYRLPGQPGFADVLSGRATLTEAIRQTPLDNLSFLPAGPCGAANPTELLNSRLTQRVFDEIRETYHYVLVDTPPVQRLSDAGVIGALGDGVLMVVRMHSTHSTLVRQSVRWLQSNNLHVVGCIATACRPHVDRYAYDAAHHDE